METKRLLIVEDDTITRRLLSEVLGQAGYQVSSVTDGSEALDALRKQGLPHLILLDLGLPTMHGFVLGEQIKRMGDVPIIILTGDDTEESILRGLREYADDYITKPFNVREVVARVQRVLSRVNNFSYAQAPAIQIDAHLLVDFSNNQITIDDRRATLTPIESGLLSVLMRNKGQIVPSEVLIARVWPNGDVDEEALRVHIFRLRRKLHTDSIEYIHTERGVGYAFCFTESA
jgi:DNA-binding response OmpR family regulator